MCMVNNGMAGDSRDDTPLSTTHHGRRKASTTKGGTKPISPTRRQSSRIKTSTPVDATGGGVTDHLPGHDDLPSPIQRLPVLGQRVKCGAGLHKGDDHPQKGLDPLYAHDGLTSPAGITDQASSPLNEDYVHPAALSSVRSAHWPRPMALDSQYPQLAYIYKAVLSTGVPNSLAAKQQLPTNLKVSHWVNIATGHPDDDIVIQGIKYGFPTQYWGPPRPTNIPGYNHTSAKAYPASVREYIDKELEEMALIGAFRDPPFEWVHFSPMMSRPKAGGDHTARRIIVDLSFPQGYDINSCISKNVYFGTNFTHTLPTTDSLVWMIGSMGYQGYMYTIDIARAYRNFHSDPLDWPLMGIAFEGDVLIDTALPFRARNSSFYMQKVAEFIDRSLTLQGACVLIYLDDLVGVAHDEDTAHLHYNMACELLGDLGLPLALKKLAPPSPRIQWLGILFDIPNRTISIPQAKIQEILKVITDLYSRSAMTRRDVQQLAGKINFVARVCRPARLFMARILSYLRAHPPGYTKVSLGAKADLPWFLKFLPTYNGISLMPQDAPTATIEANSCLKGGGALRGTRCYMIAYTEEYSENHHISQLEAANCMVAIRTLVTPEDRGHLIEIHCDNSAAVSVYHTGRGRDSVILACARAIWAHAAKCDCSLAFKHVPGELMGAADALSRAPLSPHHRETALQVMSQLDLHEVEVSDQVLNYSDFL